MPDITHSKGFPEGWTVQERSSQEALLCAKNWQGFSQAYCCKPPLMEIEAWLPIARVMAAAIESAHQEQLAETEYT